MELDLRRRWGQLDRVQKGVIIAAGTLGFAALFVRLGRVGTLESRSAGPVLPWVPTSKFVGSTIPENNRYYITMFGGGRDAQCASCPHDGLASPGHVVSTAPQSAVDATRNSPTPNDPFPYCSSTGSTYTDGTWWYIAGAIGNHLGRWPCGTHVRVTNPQTGVSAVAVVADMGPGSRVERQAGGAIIDASPLVVRHLFGRDGFGWSDRKEVIAEVVDRSVPVGPAGIVGV